MSSGLAKPIDCYYIKGMTDLEFVVSLLDLSEDDIIRSIISNYSPSQPGALIASWNKRKGYRNKLSAGDVWKIFERAGFKCQSCGRRYRMALDHMDNRSKNSTIENLQILCQHCNRAKRGCGVKHRDTGLTILKEIRRIFEGQESKVSAALAFNRAGIPYGGSAMYLVKFILFLLNSKIPGSVEEKTLTRINHKHRKGRRKTFG